MYHAAMAGTHYGRYEVVRELGRGGMGVVYLAHDPRFDRHVALKVLTRQLVGDDSFRARFDREAHAIASLEHEAIVPVHDYGEQDGEPFLVFRYLDGGNLQDRLKQHPLALAEATAMLDRIAGALDHAHAHGVIHRDLKPANILFDAGGRAWLADFGIARLTDHGTTLTSAGFVGSPTYMSPEQWEGRPATAASDIYSLGCTLYEALGGRPPYEGETAMAVGMKHVREAAPPLRGHRPDLPPAAEQAVARAMAKQPGERFGTAREFAGAFSSSPGQDRGTAANPGPSTVWLPPPGAPAATPGAPSQASGKTSGSIRLTPSVLTPVHLPPAERPRQPAGRAGPSRRLLAVAAVAVAVLVAAGAAAVALVAGGGGGPDAPPQSRSTADGATASQSPSATPALTSTATALASRSATLAPATPVATPVSPWPQIGLPADPIQRAVVEAVNRNGPAYIDAMCSRDTAPLDSAFTGAALAHYRDSVTRLAATYTACPQLLSIELKTLSVNGGSASVRTFETWKYFPQSGCATTTYDETYELAFVSGRWLVANNPFVELSTSKC